MKLIACIPLLPVFLFHPVVVNGDQVALRARSKAQLSARSIPSHAALFDPTDEETFYVSSDEPHTLFHTTHRASWPRYVNFEKFEDYIRPQDRLCIRSPDNGTTLLSFPLHPVHYSAARESWEGNEGLVFIGHDSSCHAAQDERSSYKALSITFDDTANTVKVTGKQLHETDKDYPHATEISMSRPPTDIALTRKRDEEDDEGLSDNLECLFDIDDCFIDYFATPLDIEGYTFTFDDEYQERKQLWPPENSIFEDTGVPKGFELSCVGCETTGEIEQEFHIEIQLSATDEEKGDEEDEDGDDNDSHQTINDRVKRAWIRWTVTEEIRVRKQFEVLTTGGIDVSCNIPLAVAFPVTGNPCALVLNAGGLTWVPNDAIAAKTEAAEKGGTTSIKGVASGFGINFFKPLFGLYAWINFGVGTEFNMTFPGFELTIPKGEVMEATIMGGEDGLLDKSFNPAIKMLPADLSIEKAQVHLNVAVGPKAEIQINVPFTETGFGFGIRLDMIRFDTQFADFENVNEKCENPSTLARREDVVVEVAAASSVFEKAFGFTVDIKTGVYAFVRIAGFYIDSGWVGTKAPGTDMSGLYWGIKNLVAICKPCDTGESLPCLATPINELLGVAATGFNWLAEKVLAKALNESTSVNKDGIDTLDQPTPGEEMPTGDTEKVCVATYEGGEKRKRDDDDLCQEEN